MSEEDVLRGEMKRAGRARELLENDIFKDAISQVEQALLAGMRNAAIVDDRLRLRLLDRYELLQSLVEIIKTTIETGEFAKAQLAELEKKTLVERALKLVGMN